MVGMGILQLLTKPKEKKSLGVCVPEAYREKHKQEVEETPQLPPEEPARVISRENAFRVSGIFAVQNSTMLQIEMLRGTLKLGTKIEFGGKKLKVVDISVNRKPAGKINEGQRGALFFKAKTPPLIKVGDILEF